MEANRHPRQVCAATRLGPSARGVVAVRTGRAGFTIIELLVSIAVMALLVAILLPSLSVVRETAHRVVCQSNLRQVGLGLAIYADDYDEALPPSVFRPLRGPASAAQMDTLRLSDDEARQRYEPGNTARYGTMPAELTWDGLGKLIHWGYLPAPPLFYCPSHQGELTFRRFAPLFGEYRAESNRRIIANYHYRGVGPNGSRRLWRVQPSDSSLVSDALRSKQDINHEGGFNVLRADLSLAWLPDVADQIFDLLPEQGPVIGGGPGQAAANDPANRGVEDAWDALDTGGDAEGR